MAEWPRVFHPSVGPSPPHPSYDNIDCLYDNIDCILSINCALAKSDALVPSQGEQTLYRVGLLNTVRNSLYKPQRPDLHPESKFRVFKPSKCASFYKVYCAVGLLQNKWCSILAEEQTLVFCAWFMPPTFIMFHKHMSQVKRLKCLSGTANH